MPKNMAQAERIGRVILGVAGILVAALVTGWTGWIRGIVGLAGVAFLATAAGGY
jgi:hypothetical protein